MASRVHLPQTGHRLLKQLLKAAGPGILFASTAIGVSHLVQSTRAGADYGYGLLVVVVLANVLKYPFFEFGSRYALVTGESLIDGYRRMGRWMFFAYIAVTAVTMFFVSAAVGAVTAGFLTRLFRFADEDAAVVTPLLFAVCAVVLIIGQYRFLDKLIKVIGSVLVLGTLLAFLSALGSGARFATPGWRLPDFSNNAAAWPFLIALMGWMPTAVDLSAWNSLWTLERIKASGYRPTLRETLLDFRFGYIVSSVLAVVFLVIGALLMFGDPNGYPNSAVGFADRLLNVYAGVFGHWSYLVMAIAAFCIMFGTCIAVFDGYARAAVRSMQVINKASTSERGTRLYTATVLVTALGAYGVITIFGAQLSTLIDLATTLSFLIAPVIAAANFYLVKSASFPKEQQPGTLLTLLSWTGVVFLTVFAAVYLLF